MNADNATTWRVLIAEDDPVVRQVLVDLLAEDGRLQCAGVAVDAGEAVDVAERGRPDVAVLDVRMPGGGGPRAARDIRRVSPVTRIVAFSAFDDRAAKAEMERAGAAAFLVKGVSVAEVLGTIRLVCERP